MDCGPATYLGFVRTIVDQGGTVRDLFEMALLTPGSILYADGHGREVLHDTPPCEILKEWKFLRGWRTDDRARIWCGNSYEPGFEIKWW